MTLAWRLARDPLDDNHAVRDYGVGREGWGLEEGGLEGLVISRKENEGAPGTGAEVGTIAPSRGVRPSVRPYDAFGR